MSIQNATLIKKGLAFGGTIPDYSSAIGYKESIGDTCKNPNGYTVGSFFVGSNDGYFYKVTSAIAYGDTLTVGTNCEQTSVAYELMNGGGGGSAEDIGIRYVGGTTDMIQLYYDGQWVDWMSPGMSYPIGSIVQFTYAGDVQEFTVPASGTWKIEVYGAQGGNASGGFTGGKGGYAYGNKVLYKDDILYVCVGQAGTLTTSGQTNTSYNGGGKGASGGVQSSSYGQWAGSGGGATHVAKEYIGSDGTLRRYSDTADREKLILVAGGGGGAYYDTTAGGRNGNGGTGGGTTGGTATSSGGYTISGGTQTTGYAFGIGGSCYTYGAGAGGGWYGGTVYSAELMPAGGGSGHINTAELINNTTGMENNVNEGNGFVKFTYISRDVS